MPTPGAPLTARVDDARGELRRLSEEITGWFARRRGLDPGGRFEPQLEALQTVLETATAGVEATLPAAGSAPDLAGHEACRRVERGTVWLRRVWAFYRRPFDQREDETTRVARMLAAADEIAWSCYAPAFRNAGLAVPVPPLAYVEDRYSPFAVPRLQPPPDLRYDVDATFLASFLAALPVPVLGLPPVCVEQPGWLVLMAHEAGHHVQFDLLPKPVADFEAWMAAAVGGPAPAGPAARWTPWSLEIFADAWSVLMTGPAALSVLVDLEMGDEARMLRSSRSYPSLYTRVALMLGLLKRLGVVPGDAARGLDPQGACGGTPVVVDTVDLRAQLTADLDTVSGVVEALATRPVARGLTLPELAGWQAEPFTGPNGVRRWAAAFRAADAPDPEATLEAPRFAIAGGLAAWAALDAYAGQARAKARETVRARILEAVAGSHEDSLRSAETKPEAGNLGARLAASVLSAPDPMVADR